MPKKEFLLNLIQWEMTSECNLQCPFCYASSEPQREQKFTKQRKKEIIKELKEVSPLSIQFIGGEPLLEKETILNTLKETYEDINMFTITTNGVLVDDQLLEELEPYKEKLLIEIPLDGNNPEIQDFLRGEGFFNKMMDKIEIINKHNMD